MRLTHYFLHAHCSSHVNNLPHTVLLLAISFLWVTTSVLWRWLQSWWSLAQFQVLSVRVHRDFKSTPGPRPPSSTTGVKVGVSLGLLITVSVVTVFVYKVSAGMPWRGVGFRRGWKIPKANMHACEWCFEVEHAVWQWRRVIMSSVPEGDGSDVDGSVSPCLPTDSPPFSKLLKKPWKLQK